MNYIETFNVNPVWARQRRIDYLTEWVAEYKTRLDLARMRWERNVKDGVSLMDRLTEWYLADVPAIEKKLKRYGKELIMRLRCEEWGDVSPEMIEVAREADITAFCEVDMQNKTLCPWHEDKNPSCYVKNGWAYCFSCGKSGDVISFVMAKYNLHFAGAVKMITEAK